MAGKKPMKLSSAGCIPTRSSAKTLSRIPFDGGDGRLKGCLDPWFVKSRSPKPHILCVLNELEELVSAIVALLSIWVGRTIGAFISLMDDNTTRLWLTKQQDAAKRLVQQQVASFQAQIEALRAELQVATGVLQTWHEGGGDQGSLLPRSMRIDVPKFSGVDPESWLFSINETLLCLTHPLINCWESELLVSKPTTLGDAFALARVTEARLDDQGMVVVAPNIASTSGGSQYQRSRSVMKTPLILSPPKAIVSTNGKPLAIKWISPAERHERLSKGLCFNCDNRWT
nr:Ty3/gypsy retrotransposon protein [Tanacetum cinerariifolium]